MARYIKVLRSNFYFIIFLILLVIILGKSIKPKEKKTKASRKNTKKKINKKKGKVVKLQTNSINLNKAKLKELKKIKGIGPNKALKIIEYRQKHGKIYNVNELLNVDGIGKKILSRINKYSYANFE